MRAFRINPIHGYVESLAASEIRGQAVNQIDERRFTEASG